MPARLPVRRERRLFAYISPRYSTPTRSIYLMGALTLIGSLFLHFEIAAELLNFGAFVGFILVNLSVIRHFYLREHQRNGIHFFTNLVFPLCGALFTIYLWISLRNEAKIAGFVWLAIGVVYLAFITNGFRVAPKSITSLTQAPAEHSPLP